MSIFMSWGLWLITTKVGRIVLISVASLVGWFSFSQYYKHQGRAQVYEKIERNNEKAEKTREKIDDRSRVTPDDRLDRWLRERASD